MKTPQNEDLLKHLPQYGPLLEYDATPWIAFGTLTHRYATSPITQLKRFKILMEKIGSLNRSEGKRLHWVVRSEFGLIKKLAEDGVDEPQWHLHFALAGHKVTDAHRHSMTIEEACKFLHQAWKHGRRKVVPYDSTKDGLGYILECPFGPKSDDWNDRVEISTSLMTVLKNKKTDETSADRDPLAVEILLGLRQRGATAWFGDEVPQWRAA